MKKKNKSLNNYLTGLQHGVPIALGYLSVSFTFGLKAAGGGIPIISALIISMTNLTSAGQFAGADIIIAGGRIFELAAATFIINMRYMLMSFSLSQKAGRDIGLFERLVMSFGLTDEIFAVASMRPGKLDFKYFLGLMTLPYIGWSLGTLLGAAAGPVLPELLGQALNLAIYGMFIAIVIPPAKKSAPVVTVCLIACAVSALFKLTPGLNTLSGGWVIIIATVAAAGTGAFLFAKEEI